MSPAGDLECRQWQCFFHHRIKCLEQIPFLKKNVNPKKVLWNIVVEDPFYIKTKQTKKWKTNEHLRDLRKSFLRGVFWITLLKVYLYTVRTCPHVHFSCFQWVASNNVIFTQTSSHSWPSLLSVRNFWFLRRLNEHPQFH